MTRTLGAQRRHEARMHAIKATAQAVATGALMLAGIYALYIAIWTACALSTTCYLANV